jgi:hypothetical protein
MGNLARPLGRLMGWDKALKLQEQVLAVSRKVLGPEHLDTITAMHDVAVSYWKTDRFDEAIKLQEPVLALRRKLLGPEHPDTLSAMNDLANSYSDTTQG